MTFFSEKFPFSRPKILMTFLVIDQVFLIFPFFFQNLRISQLTVLNVVYDPFFTRKTTISEKNSLTTLFFTLFVLSRASENTTSQNIGGTDAWAVPHLKFCGDRPPVHLGLRPWRRLCFIINLSILRHSSAREN